MCTRPWAHPERNIWGLGSSWGKEPLRLSPPYLELGWSQSSPEVHERMICPLWFTETALSMGLNWSWKSILTSVNIVSYSKGFKAAPCTIQTRLSTRCLPPIWQMLFIKFLRNKYWSKQSLAFNILSFWKATINFDVHMQLPVWLKSFNCPNFWSPHHD